jgi:hypothetical protein
MRRYTEIAGVGGDGSRFVDRVFGLVRVPLIPNAAVGVSRLFLSDAAVDFVQIRNSLGEATSASTDGSQNHPP